MYINPDSNIILLKGVPLDNTYKDTIFFKTKEEQYNKIYSYPKKVYTKQSYQRCNKNTLRIEGNAEQLYHYNYLMFQNKAYGDKWFYCFILQTNYINDNTTEIVYEIDVLQTWHFDYTLLPSYVEREHSRTDEIGEYLEDEPVNVDNVICSDIYFPNENFLEYVIVICSAPRDTIIP